MIRRTGWRSLKNFNESVALWHIRQYCTESTFTWFFSGCKALYTLLIRSIVTYITPVWNYTRDLNYLKLQVVQTRAYECIPLSITNKMQSYTIFFIIVNAVHVSGSFSAHHQELKNCTYSIGYFSSLLAATASLAYTRCCMYSFWAPVDGRGNHPKHVQHWQ